MSYEFSEVRLGILFAVKPEELHAGHAAGGGRDSNNGSPDPGWQVCGVCKAGDAVGVTNDLNTYLVNEAELHLGCAIGQSGIIHVGGCAIGNETEPIGRVCRCAEKNHVVGDVLSVA